MYAEDDLASWPTGKELDLSVVAAEETPLRARMSLTIEEGNAKSGGWVGSISLVRLKR